MSTRRKQFIKIIHEIIPDNLLDEVIESLVTPQWNHPSHYEGVFLLSHLDLMLKTLVALIKNEPHQEVPPTISPLMVIAAEDCVVIIPFIFLHDLSKKDFLTVCYKEREWLPTWKEWETKLQKSRTGRNALGGDWASMKNYCHLGQISQIHYQRENGEKTHAEETADRLRYYPDFPSIMPELIEASQVVDQFEEGKINIPLFKKTFSQWPEENIIVALVCIYLNKMASLRENNQPDLASFISLANTYLAWEDLGVKLQEALEPFVESNILSKKRAEEIVRRFLGDEIPPYSQEFGENRRAILAALKRTEKRYLLAHS